MSNTTNGKDDANRKDGTKKLVVIRGKGTPREERVETDVDLYWSETLKRWVSIPE